MAKQIILVDDAAPGAVTDAGITSDGTTVTSTKALAGTSLALSSTLAATGNVAINTNKFTVTAASGNTLVAGTLTSTGNVTASAAVSVGTTLTCTGIATFNEAIALGATENAANDGAWAIPITKKYQSMTTNSTAALAATLADGSVGQEIILELETKDTNNMVVTPANLTGGTTITFDASAEIAHLIFVGTAWKVISTTATVA